MSLFTRLTSEVGLTHVKTTRYAKTNEKLKTCTIACEEWSSFASSSQHVCVHALPCWSA